MSDGMKPAKALAIMLTILGVVLAFQAVILGINPSTLPDDIASVIIGLQYALSTTSAAVGFTILRNFTGYIKNALEGKTLGLDVEYEATLLGATWTKYQASALGFTKAVEVMLVGTPYAGYAVLLVSAVTFACDIVASTISKLTGA